MLTLYGPIVELRLDRSHYAWEINTIPQNPYVFWLFQKKHAFPGETRCLGDMRNSVCRNVQKKKRRRRIWTCRWLRRRGKYGLSILQRELEVSWRFLPSFLFLSLKQLYLLLLMHLNIFKWNVIHTQSVNTVVFPV